MTAAAAAVAPTPPSADVPAAAVFSCCTSCSSCCCCCCHHGGGQPPLLQLFRCRLPLHNFRFCHPDHPWCPHSTTVPHALTWGPPNGSSEPPAAAANVAPATRRCPRPLPCRCCCCGKQTLWLVGCPAGWYHPLLLLLLLLLLGAGSHPQLPLVTPAAAAAAANNKGFGTAVAAAAAPALMQRRGWQVRRRLPAPAGVLLHLWCMSRLHGWLSLDPDVLHVPAVAATPQGLLSTPGAACRGRDNPHQASRSEGDCDSAAGCGRAAPGLCGTDGITGPTCVPASPAYGA
jgi:hypothetical protein